MFLLARAASGKKRGRLELNEGRVVDETAWQSLFGAREFQAKLHACGTDLDGMRAAFAMPVLAMLEVQPGTAWSGVFTMWDSEERCMFPVLKCSSGAYSCNVSRVMRFVRTVEGRWHSLAATGWHVGRGFTPLTEACASSALACPVVCPPSTATASSADILQSWGCSRDEAMNAISVVFPLEFALVVAHGHWHKLMFTIAQTKQFPKIFASPLWPPKQFWQQGSLAFSTKGDPSMWRSVIAGEQ